MNLLNLVRKLQGFQSYLESRQFTEIEVEKAKRKAQSAANKAKIQEYKNHGH